MSLPAHFSVGQIAARYDVKPRLLTGWFYTRVLDPDRTVMVAGRRLIPEDYIPEIERILIERGQFSKQPQLASA